METITEGGAKSKTKGALEGVKEKLPGGGGGDDDDKGTRRKRTHELALAFAQQR